MVQKKAQTALEYLMTYGWAILIIIIVGASLYALGVFSPGTITGKRSTGFTQFQMTDFKLDVNTDLALVIGNRLGKTVELTKIVTTYKQETCNSTLSENIGPNVQKTYTLDCLSEWGTLDQKTTYTVIVDFYYTDPDSELEHIDTGTLFGIVE